MDIVVAASLTNAHPDRPVHFLGIGRMKDIFRYVRMGVDTFDCVIPTRLARHGTAFLQGAKGETINLKNAKYRDDHTPIDPRNAIPASAEFTKAYIHHLLKCEEILGIQILAQHNVATLNRLMREVRAAIRAGTLDQLEKEWLGS
jgi:queuine tRNA-ribosyltransferase